MKATITNINPVEVTYPPIPDIHDHAVYAKGEDIPYRFDNDGWNRSLNNWQSTKKTARVVNVETANNGTPYIEFEDDKGELSPVEASLGMTVEFEPETRMITKIL